jgi:hypothetical protein
VLYALSIRFYDVPYEDDSLKDVAYSPQLFSNDKAIIIRTAQPKRPRDAFLEFLRLGIFAFGGFLVFVTGFRRVVFLHPPAFVVT